MRLLPCPPQLQRRWIPLQCGECIIRIGAEDEVRNTDRNYCRADSNLNGRLEFLPPSKDIGKHIHFIPGLFLRIVITRINHPYTKIASPHQLTSVRAALALREGRNPCAEKCLEACERRLSDLRSPWPGTIDLSSLMNTHDGTNQKQAHKGRALDACNEDATEETKPLLLFLRL